MPRAAKASAASKRAARHAERVRKMQAKLAPKLPHIGPHDLNLILDCLLRKPSERRVFLRKRGDRYVF